MSDSEQRGLPINEPLSRRKLLQGAGAGLLVVGGGSVLAACGSSGSSSSAAGRTTAGPGKPQPGGVLRVGAQGGSNTDTLDAHNVLTNADYARLAQLYDPLVRISNKGTIEKVLADSITSNKQATEWTIRIKKGVVDHELKPFGAKDVIFSLRRIVKGKYPGAIALGPIDINSLRELDEQTVQVKYLKPFSIFEEALALHWYMYMVPVGYNPARPIGTGPFKLVSFTPGRESKTVKFQQYWNAPKPYLDEVVTIDIAEETAQVAALQSGQVDCIDYLTAASVPTLESSGQQVIISETGGWVPFTMRVDRAPFEDNRVREALKLVIDRPKMLESVFAGNGTVANDIFSYYDPAVQSLQLPQREQDIEKAKSLLKQAGQSDLSLQLVTTPNAPGMVQAAVVFKTQAEEAGVNTAIVKQPVTEYFARSYLKVPFSQDYWCYIPYLVNVSEATLKGAPFSATKFNDPRYNKLFEQATATTDKGHQTELIHEMVKIDWSEGGNIIPFYFPIIDAAAPNVHGIEPSIVGQALSTFQFMNFWMS
ncbi:MAG: ABC transporter substrate-binding protein [Actinobacteria bacterium]|nr:ABC transporter substrate-binding protein [Actinomycetota bacterium]